MQTDVQASMQIVGDIVRATALCPQPVVSGVGGGEGPAWQLIDTAPKDGRDVVLFCPAGGQYGDLVTVGRWVDVEHRNHGVVTYTACYWHLAQGELVFSFAKRKPTHWLPLPPKPVISAAEDQPRSEPPPASSAGVGSPSG